MILKEAVELAERIVRDEDYGEILIQLRRRSLIKMSAWVGQKNKERREKLGVHAKSWNNLVGSERDTLESMLNAKLVEALKREPGEEIWLPISYRELEVVAAWSLNIPPISFEDKKVMDNLRSGRVSVSLLGTEDAHIYPYVFEFLDSFVVEDGRDKKGLWKIFWELAKTGKPKIQHL